MEVQEKEKKLIRKAKKLKISASADEEESVKPAFMQHYYSVQTANFPQTPGSGRVTATENSDSDGSQTKDKRRLRSQPNVTKVNNAVIHSDISCDQSRIICGLANDWIAELDPKYFAASPLSVANCNFKRRHIGLSHVCCSKTSSTVFYSSSAQDGAIFQWDARVNDQSKAVKIFNLTCSGAIAFGTMFGWSATALPDLRDDASIGIEDADVECQWIGSLMILGALVSGPIVDYLLEWFGRRMSMLLLSAPCLAGWALIFFAQNVEMVYAGRFLTGFSGGAFSIVAPIYIAETSDPDIRGKLSSGFDMGIAIGILYIEAIGAYLPWKIQTAASAALTVIGHFMIMFVPESPRHLVSKGQLEQATKALMWLNNTSDPRDIEHELHELEEIAAANKLKEDEGSWKDLFSYEILKPCSVAMMIHLFSSMSGNIAITAYTVDIFLSAEISLNEYYATLIFGFLDAVAAVAVSAVVDSLGRRPLLIGSQLIMAISLAGTGTYFYVKEANDGISPEGLDWLPVASLAIFIAAFAGGTGPISYMLMGEILPPKAKGLGASIITIVKWLTAFLTTRFFFNIMHMFNESGGYWFFAAWCLLGVFYVIFCVPETKGKTLEEIQLKYVRN